MEEQQARSALLCLFGSFVALPRPLDVEYTNKLAQNIDDLLRIQRNKKKNSNKSASNSHNPGATDTKRKDTKEIDVQQQRRSQSSKSTSGSREERVSGGARGDKAKGRKGATSKRKKRKGKTPDRPNDVQVKEVVYDYQGSGAYLLEQDVNACLGLRTRYVSRNGKKLEAAREEQQTEEAGCSVVRPVAGLRTPTRRGDKVPLVIFFNGTFGPVHQGHLNTLFDARRLLEAKGHEILGGFISTCWSGYSDQKLKEHRICTRHRLNMLKLAVQNHDWLIVDTNQTVNVGHPDLFAILISFYEDLCGTPSLKGSSFKVAWLNGADNAPPVPFPLDFIIPVCIVNPARAEVEKLDWLRQEYSVYEEEGLCYLFEQRPLDISSTAIRRAIQQGESLTPYYGSDGGISEVAAYMQDHALWTPIESSSEKEEEESAWSKYFPSFLWTKRGDDGNSKARTPACIPRMDSGEVIRGIREGNSTQMIRDQDFWEKEKEEDEKVKEDSARESRRKRKTESRVRVYPGAVPRHHGELDLEDLSRMLFFGGVIDGSVVAFKWERIGQGRGWRSLLVRLYDIEYETAEDRKQAPKTMIMKFPLGNRREEGSETRVETLFYKHFSHRLVSVRVPGCYFAHFDEETERGVVIIEDLKDWQFYHFQEPIPEPSFWAAVESLAEFHSEWWQHPYLKDLDWLDNPNLLRFTMKRFSYTFYRRPALFKNMMGEKLFESCKRWGESIPQIWKAITERGWTLVHGDLWINNLLFNPNQDIPPLYGENRVALVDWQTCCKSSGLIDLSLLLLTLMRDEAEETKILRHYYDSVCRFGVNPAQYKWEDCKRDWLLARKLTFCITLPATFQFLELMELDPDVFMTEEDKDTGELRHQLAGAYFLKMGKSLHEADEKQDCEERGHVPIREQELGWETVICNIGKKV